MEKINNYKDSYNSLFLILLIILTFIIITFINHQKSKNNTETKKKKIIKQNISKKGTESDSNLLSPIINHKNNTMNKNLFGNENHIYYNPIFRNIIGTKGITVNKKLKRDIKNNHHIEFITLNFLINKTYQDILINSLNNYLNYIGILFNFSITPENLKVNLTYAKNNLKEINYQIINKFFTLIYQQKYPNPYYTNLSDLQLLFFINILIKSLVPDNILSNLRYFFKSSCLFPNNKQLLITNQKIINPVNINSVIKNDLIILNRNNQSIFFNKIIPKSSKTVIILGSYTCPHWRYFAPKIILFCLKNQISFFFIYTQEAHSNLWMHDKNLSLSINYQHPNSILQKLFLADQAYDFILRMIGKQNKYHLPNINMYIDLINNKVDHIFLSGGLLRVFLLNNNYLIWNSLPFQFSLSQLQSKI